jgi:hypothetical protein
MTIILRDTPKNEFDLLEDSLKDSRNSSIIGTKSDRANDTKKYFIEVKGRDKFQPQYFYFKKEEYDKVLNLINKYIKIHKNTKEKKKHG